MSAAAQFLSRFAHVKRTGDQWLVQCPAHEDHKASLAVREASDGKVLLHCHGGCTTAAVLSRLGLEETALFPPSERSSESKIVATYDYTDGDGVLRYQSVRYFPKNFKQRRPDGAGGWTWSLKNVDRVLYRMPALRGKETCIIVEGEKDAEAAWAQKIPATTNAGGAGKWTEDLTRQLVGLGMKKAAVLADNDDPGVQHAHAVAQSLTTAGIEARVVRLPDLPPKGDLSDFLAYGHSREELLALVRQTPVWTPAQVPTPPPPARIFLPIAETRYQLKIDPEGIVLDLDRLHRTHGELVGELAVTVNGSCPDAKAIDGIISTADLNLSSAQARVTRAKLLAERSGNKDLDWTGYLEELCVKVLRSERAGAPAVRFADLAVIDEDAEPDVQAETFMGLQVLLDAINIVFGDPGAMKSYLAIWIAGQLAQKIPVLYCDWELNIEAHHARVRKLFQPLPPNLFYVNCSRPLVQEADRIARIQKAEGIGFFVFDSIGMACEGRPEEAENANAYMRIVRGFKVGSLNLAHISKRDSEDAEGKNDPKIFGSRFFEANARSIYFMQRAENQPDPNVVPFGLYDKKYSYGNRRPPVGLTLTFQGRRRAVFEPTAVESVDELAAKLPILERLKQLLNNGTAMSAKAVAEDLAVPPNTIRAMFSRHKSVFVKVGDKYSLRSQSLEF